MMIIWFIAILLCKWHSISEFFFVFFIFLYIYFRFINNETPQLALYGWGLKVLLALRWWVYHVYID